MVRKSAAAARRDEARRRWLQEWDRWAPQNLPADRRPTGTDGFRFFMAVKGDPFLDFESTGDAWQTVQAWLLAAGKIER
ncbi:MAG TPA: hypothetical protein VH684_11595 [Xanthobacteraceae bacterium]|jgi:hypothetical protein